jgi:hypothetical protein
MSIFKPNNKERIIDPLINELNKLAKSYTISTSLDENISTMKKLFADDDNIIYREIKNDKLDNFKCYIVYCKSVANTDVINENIIKPLMLSNIIQEDNVLDIIKNKVVQIAEVKTTSKMQDIINDITYGDTILFINNISKALILNTKAIQTRAITQPETEMTLSGPREGFTLPHRAQEARPVRRAPGRDRRSRWAEKSGRRSAADGAVATLLRPLPAQRARPPAALGRSRLPPRAAVVVRPARRDGSTDRLDCLAGAVAGQAPETMRVGRIEYRRDLRLLPLAGGAPQTPQIDKPARATEPGV